MKRLPTRKSSDDGPAVRSAAGRLKAERFAAERAEDVLLAEFEPAVDAAEWGHGHGMHLETAVDADFEADPVPLREAA